ncbi:MAG TPA: hypothetical protein VKZ56_09170 [Membranihabitans sp.]|nr:hypothetical protein [Membranihabitans sp.]
MYKLFSKYGLLLAFSIGLIFTLIFLIPVLSGLPEGFSEMAVEEQSNTNVFDVGLKATIGLLIAAVIILILGSLLTLAKNPKGALKGIIGIAILLVLIFVLYSTTDDETNRRVLAAMDEFGVSQNLLKWISASIRGAFVLSGAALVLMLLGEVRNLFK